MDGGDVKARHEWVDLMLRVATIRDRLIFWRRLRFDNELRPFTENGQHRIAYPDAIYRITKADVDRAEEGVVKAKTTDPADNAPSELAMPQDRNIIRIEDEIAWRSWETKS